MTSKITSPGKSAGRPFTPPISVLLCVLFGFAYQLPARLPDPVIWKSPSEGSSGSMPIGNGDIGLNVWAEANGNVRFYVAKSDAWDGAGRLLRLGGVDIAFSPNPFEVLREIPWV